MPNLTNPPTTNRRLLAFVDEAVALCQPDSVHWCDGSTEEYDAPAQKLVDAGTFQRLSRRSAPTATSVCPIRATWPESKTARSSAPTLEIDAGPTNNWREPSEMRDTLRGLFEGSMRGRTLYVVPFSMVRSVRRSRHIGVQVTDSPYVAVSMRIMTRMGAAVLDVLGDADFVPCMHSVGYPLVDDAGTARPDVPWPCDADNKYIVHFPESREIWSYGSGYGATPSWARSVSRCASHRRWRATTDGSRSTCSSSA